MRLSSFWLSISLLLIGCHNDPVTPPISTTGTPVSFYIKCPTNQPCVSGEEFQVYRRVGTCPASLTESSGWSLVTTVTATSGYQFTDTSVVSGTTYSYAVEGVIPNVSFSGPSSCLEFNVI
jgi:hypothetical protein